MALSQTVTDSLNEAKLHLRNALAFAARSERPVVCKQISEMIFQCEHIGSLDEIFDSIEDLKNK